MRKTLAIKLFTNHCQNEVRLKSFFEGDLLARTEPLKTSTMQGSGPPPFLCSPYLPVDTAKGPDGAGEDIMASGSCGTSMIAYDVKRSDKNENLGTIEYQVDVKYLTYA